MKNKSVIALMLAFTMCFTSVCPALAAENTAVESEGVNESETEEVSEENAAPAEEADSEEQKADGADEDATEASSDKPEEPVEAEEAEEAADVTELTEDTADAAKENEDISDETTDVVVAEAATEEYSKKAGEASGPEFTDPIMVVVEEQTAAPGNSGDESPEDLFEEYMNVAFGLSEKSSMRKAKKSTGTRLQGNDLAVYQVVAEKLPEIAAGERESTEFELTLDDFGIESKYLTAEELGVPSIVVENEQGGVSFAQDAFDAANARISFDLHKVLTALLVDFPYELYWFNKSIDGAIGVSEYSIGGSYMNGEYVAVLPESITLRLKVAGEFSGADEYTVNTEIGQSVQTAVNNANDIIEQHSGDADEDKLHNYKDAICNLVSYNHDAADGNFDFNYGNPWQLLWVFDGIEETKVVCEGYSKAFKYLCDKSSFDSGITCILVTGTMAGGTGAGGHMWNIVKMGDRLNYLADVTNCDDGSIGSPNKLFLVRPDVLDTDGEIETGYTFHLGGSSVAYSYDEDTLTYYNQNEISLGELQHVHDLIKTEAKAATCTEAGNIEYWTCSECGKIFIDEAGETEIDLENTVVPVKAHTLMHVEAMDATCTETGNKEHWKCSECGALFSDADGTTATTEEAVEIAAKGHTLAKVEAMDATCTETGNKEHWKCSDCGALFSDAEGTTATTEDDVEIAATGHRLTHVEAKEATCTEAGNIEYWTCSECGKRFSDAEGTTEITAEATVVAAKGHSLEKTEAKDATCTEAGNIEYWTCSECEKLFKDSEGTQETTEEYTVIEAKGHDWGEWTVVKEATEEEEGLETRTCQNDDSHTEERTISKLNHVHNLEKTDAKTATCTEAGNIEYWTCSECGKLFSDAAGTTQITAEATVVAAKGHFLEKMDAKDATCTEAGNIEYWTCSECGKLYKDSEGTQEITAADTVVAAKGHSLEKNEAKDATCTEAGNTEYWTCSVCKKLFSDGEGTTEITEADTVVAAKGHSLEKIEAKDATCTEAGNTEYWTCSECKKLFSDADGKTETTAEDTVVAAKSHSLEKTEAKDATCTEAGNTEYWTCSVCKKLFGDDQGTTETTAADTVVAAKGHSLEKTEAVDATCTEAGNIEYLTCSKCNKLYKDSEGTQEITEADTVVAAKGHNWTEWTVVTKATEEKEGLETRTCLNDESHKEERTIPKLQGTWKKNSKGWWYDRGNGSYPKGTFETIKGTTYYFNESGYMLTGWQKISGEWYYFSADGAMQTDWQNINGTWYYMEASGVMAANKWVGNYYLTGSGAMAKNTWIGNYYVGADGKWIPGYK